MSGRASTSGALRVVFLGNDPWSVPSLEALAASSHTVALVVTRVPRPARRGSGLKPTAVAEAARRLELPLLEVETVGSGAGFAAIEAAAPDVLVVVAYGEILPPELLALPGNGAVNVHFSLLPSLRGAAPVQTAILQGLGVTGVSTMLMDEGLDTGPILLQAEEPIREEDDAGTLGERLARVGAVLLVRTLEGMASGGIVPAPQPESMAGAAPKLTAEDRRLDWSAGPEAIVRKIRALAPKPGASAAFRGDVLKILRARPVQGAGEPGVIASVGKEGFTVGAGEGMVELIELAPAGRRRMTAAEFVRGFRPRVGERLE